MSTKWSLEEKKSDDPYDLAVHDGEEEGMEALWVNNGSKKGSASSQNAVQLLGAENSSSSVLNTTQDTVDTTNLSISFDESIIPSPPQPQKKKKGFFGGGGRNKNNTVARSSPKRLAGNESADSALFVSGANINMVSQRQRSQHVQEFIATVVDNDSAQPDYDLEMEDDDAESVKSIDEETSKRLQQAMDDDDEESIASLDGIKKFGKATEFPSQLIAPNDAVAVKIRLPKLKRPMSKKSPSHRRSARAEEILQPQSSVFRNPEFVTAPKGEHPAILMQQSWDSLVSNEVVSPEDAPKIIVVPEDQADHGEDAALAPLSPPRGTDRIKFVHSPRRATASESILKEEEANKKSKQKDKPWSVRRFIATNGQKATEKKQVDKKERHGGRKKVESSTADKGKKQKKKVQWRQKKAVVQSNEGKEVKTEGPGTPPKVKPVTLFCYENGKNRSMKRVLSVKSPERAVSPTRNVDH